MKCSQCEKPIRPNNTWNWSSAEDGSYLFFCDKKCRNEWAEEDSE